MLFFRLTIFCIIVIGFMSCAYYNTLFNAETRYEAGIKKIEESNDKKITQEIRQDFQAAIDKCWKLLNIYSDSSKYADDALLIIGKSHYQMEEYVKSERFLTQFVDRYRDSDMIAEAYLWLGMSLLELDKGNEALENLNKVLAEDESDDFNARAYLNIGRVFLKQENYDRARSQFNEVFDIAWDDEVQGNAQFLIAESYYQEGNYTASTENFEKVLDYDASVDLLYRAILKKKDGFLNLEQYDEAILTLESISSDTKFLYKKSVTMALIGYCYEIQGKFIESTEIYYDVLETYPRTEGSAIAAYGMGQLMEFAYADLDSAKGLYQRVRKEYKDSEYIADADARVKVITSYQKIVQNIEKDLTDLINLHDKPEDEEDNLEEVSVTEDSIEVERDRSSRNSTKKDPKQKAKRSEAEIKKSLEKNYFAKAEFFLLTLASYDSAAAGYQGFVETSNDSLLVPKAQYALYYIYAYELYHQVKADSIKQLILDEYPQSPYAAFFNAQDNTIKQDEKEESQYKYLYMQGEAMISDARYLEAIDYFNQIAEEDSGSELAQKARYASAWIYENKLDSIQGAITAYAALADEYPNSEAGKIAKEKIKIPVVEQVDTTTVVQDSSISEENLELSPILDGQLDISDPNLNNSENEGPQNPDE